MSHRIEITGLSLAMLRSLMHGCIIMGLDQLAYDRYLYWDTNCFSILRLVIEPFMHTRISSTAHTLFQPSEFQRTEKSLRPLLFIAIAITIADPISPAEIDRMTISAFHRRIAQRSSARLRGSSTEVIVHGVITVVGLSHLVFFVPS